MECKLLKPYKGFTIEKSYELKPDGIEANYILVHDGNVINDSNIWNEFADKNNLFVTVGSDFHRMDNIHPKVGLICGDLNLDEKIKNEIIKNLYNR